MRFAPTRSRGWVLLLSPRGANFFPSLSVEENLLLGARFGQNGPWMLDTVYELFPVLRDRRKQASTSLSGGQQQMAAIGRALIANPDLILLDEISLDLHQSSSSQSTGRCQASWARA